MGEAFTEYPLDPAPTTFEVFTLPGAEAVHVCWYEFQSDGLCGVLGDRDATWYVAGERAVLDTVTCPECRDELTHADEESDYQEELQRGYSQDRL